MSAYVGIDLGTTNSAICAYDGETVHVYKSPEQNDVTPSAILINKRGQKYVGTLAYNNAPLNSESAALLFKRFMGTATVMSLPALNLSMTPEECSAEILKTLYGYLPDAIRNDRETGTVITVPAAFNQMQKDATMEAAQSAGIGRVALMQEPVAAVMSVMRKRKGDGTFLVYDLGGGTLDVAIAQSIGGRVSLLSQKGIEMCGGRDFDLLLVDSIVVPWLAREFDLPEEFAKAPAYRLLAKMAVWATERAKIELSSKEETTIALGETELRVRDRKGAEIYIDVPLRRSQLDNLIARKLEESIEAARDAIQKAGLSSHHIERIVFVGGPTQYAPLRAKVAQELGIAATTEVNPMTAVAEGAAIFAESIDWSSENRGRKATRKTFDPSPSLDVSVNYIARTPDSKAKIAIKLSGGAATGFTFQVDSLDTGWSSGRIDLTNGAIVEVVLPKSGENSFKLFVFDPRGGPLSLRNDKIVITKTAAVVDAIPASHTISIEAKERVGGDLTLDKLILEGDQLPAKGRRIYKAEESLRAGSSGSLKFKIWEGEISHPISDNRLIGLFEIRGSDFDDGVIAAGSELVCDYSMLDSGNIILEVSIPSIGASFPSGRNFYSRKGAGAGIDYSRVTKLILEDTQGTLERLRDMESKVDDPTLDKIRDRLNRASELDPDETDPESAKQAMDDVQKAKELLAEARKANLRQIRGMELERAIYVFDQGIRALARPSEQTAFDNLAKSAQRSIDSGSSDFESHLGQLQSKSFMILFRQDWFVVDRFKWYLDSPHVFADARVHSDLAKRGQAAMDSNNIDELRKVVIEMDLNRMGSPDADDLLVRSNIVKG